MGSNEHKEIRTTNTTLPSHTDRPTNTLLLTTTNIHTTSSRTTRYIYTLLRLESLTALENYGGYPRILRHWEASRLLAFCLGFVGIPKVALVSVHFVSSWLSVRLLYPFLRRCTTALLLSCCCMGVIRHSRSTLQEPMSTWYSRIMYILMFWVVVAVFWLLSSLLAPVALHKCEHHVTRTSPSCVCLSTLAIVLPQLSTDPHRE